jgi:hypothetical protein
MRLGARAGFKRNERMLSLDPRYVIAFPGNGVLERLVIEAKAPAGSPSSIAAVRWAPAPRLFGQDRLRASVFAPAPDRRWRCCHQRKGVRLSALGQRMVVGSALQEAFHDRFEAVMADFAVRQAERAGAGSGRRIQQLKAVISALTGWHRPKVEIRFDGCGDSGAVEECVCLMLPTRDALSRMLDPLE